MWKIAIFCFVFPLLNSTVIILHGTSSVGKTSIAQELQQLFDEPYLHTGLDFFLPMLPKKFSVYGERAEEGIHFVTLPIDDHKQHIVIEPGTVGKQFLHAMRVSLAACAQTMNLIIEDVILSSDDMADYRALFKGMPVYCFCIYAQQAVLDDREMQRGDRKLGISRGLAQLVYKQKEYDLAIDTTNSTPCKVAALIYNYIENYPPKIFN